MSLIEARFDASLLDDDGREEFYKSLKRASFTHEYNLGKGIYQANFEEPDFRFFKRHMPEIVTVTVIEPKSHS